MAGILASNANLDEQGFAAVVRDLERHQIILDNLGGSTGDNVSQADSPTTTSTSTGLSAIPSARYNSYGAFSGSAITPLNINVYPFDSNFLLSTTYQKEFPALSISGSGTTSLLNGFNPLKSYLITFSCATQFASASGLILYYLSIRLGLTSSSTDYGYSSQQQLPVLATVTPNGESSCSFTTIISGVSSIGAAIAINVGGTGGFNVSFSCSNVQMTFLELG